MAAVLGCSPEVPGGIEIVEAVGIDDHRCGGDAGGSQHYAAIGAAPPGHEDDRCVGRSPSCPFPGAEPARFHGHTSDDGPFEQGSVHEDPGETVNHAAEPEAVEGLIQLAQTSTLVEVQRECCLAFGKLALTRGHHEKVVPVLATFLTPGFLRKDYHEDVRHAATWALGQMPEAEGARRAHKRAADDKDKRVRLTARLTLDGNKSE